MRVVYPGSFNPPTNGHLDIIRRAAARFENVTVLVMVNLRKQYALSAQARADLLTACVRDLPNVEVAVDGGLLGDAAKRLGADAVLRGLRSVADYQAEQPVADAMRALYGVETVFMQSSPEYAYISSSLAREIQAFGGELDKLVPDVVSWKLRDGTGEVQ